MKQAKQNAQLTINHWLTWRWRVSLAVPWTRETLTLGLLHSNWGLESQAIPDSLANCPKKWMPMWMLRARPGERGELLISSFSILLPLIMLLSFDAQRWYWSLVTAWWPAEVGLIRNSDHAQHVAPVARPWIQFWISRAISEDISVWCSCLFWHFWLMFAASVSYLPNKINTDSNPFRNHVLCASSVYWLRCCLKVCSLFLFTQDANHVKWKLQCKS